MYSDKIKACYFKAFCRIEIKIYKKNPIVATVIQIDVTQQPIDEFLWTFFLHFNGVFSSF